MDELSMVRELLASPPLPEVVAEGRERLLGSRRRARPSGPARISAVALRSALALGLTGAAAAARRRGVAGLRGGHVPGGGSPVVTDVSARGVLLAAAVRAESAAASGRLLARALGVEDDPAAAVRARQQPLHAGAAVGHRELDDARRSHRDRPPRVGAAKDPAGRSRVAPGRCAEPRGASGRRTRRPQSPSACGRRPGRPR